MLIHKIKFIPYHDQPIHEIESTQTHTAILKDTHIQILISSHHVHSLHGTYTHIKLTPDFLIAVTSRDIEIWDMRWRCVERIGVSGAVWAIAVCGRTLAVASQNIQVYTLPKLANTTVTNGDKNNTIKENANNAEALEDSEDDEEEEEDTKTVLKMSIPFPHKSLSLSLTPTRIYISTPESTLFALSTMRGATLTRINLKKKTICWDIRVLRKVVLCAMSDGTVCIYRRENFTLLQTVKAHDADVLCLAGPYESEKETEKTDDAEEEKGDDVFYSSGVDRVVVQYKRITTDSSTRYIIAGEKSHDVKAIKYHNGIILTGGIDQQLVTVNAKLFPDTSIHRASPFGRDAVVSCGGDGCMRLMNQSTASLNVWECIQATNNDGKDYKHVCDIKLKEGSVIVASCMSPNGTLVVCATLTETKVYDISGPVKRIHVIPSARQITFSRDGKLCVLVEGERIVVRDTVKFDIVSEILGGDDVVTAMTMSDDNAWLCVAGITAFRVFNMDTLHLHYSTLYQSTITAIAISSTNNLAVSLNDKKIIVFDIERKRISDWYAKNVEKFPVVFMGIAEIVRGMVWCENKILIHGTTFYAIIDTTIDLLGARGMKRKLEVASKSADWARDQKQEQDAGFRMCFDYSSIMHMGKIGEDLCCVERPLLTMMEGLPASFHKKTFGT